MFLKFSSLKTETDSADTQLSTNYSLLFKSMKIIFNENESTN